jgi:hypothetical protein
MDTDDDMPEDEFLELPEQALPGDLSRLWAIRSNLLHQHEYDELNRELAGEAPPRLIFAWTSPYEKHRIEEKRRREQLEFEQAMLEISEHQDRLLRQINEEQVRITQRRKEIEDNALRLQDGRRVYVDSDRYRDGEGRLLTGADEAEAARQHEYRPDSSTWAQKQDIERREKDAQDLKDKIEQDRASGQGTPQESAQRLDVYEKEFADKVQERAAQPVTDYGSADYMSALGDDTQLSAVPAFMAAAADLSREAIRKLGDEGADTQTADIKKPPQPFGGGGMKPT